MRKLFVCLVLLMSSAFAQTTTLPMCDVNGTCNFQYNYSWGYCQWQTYQTAKTFTVALEIGIAAGNVSDVCYVPLAFGGNITSIDGDTSYVPWTQNLSSMFVNIRACTGLNFSCNYPSQQEHLVAHKYAVKNMTQTVPFTKVLATPMYANGFMIVFNDDLPAAKPTTINISFTGTLQ